MHLGRIGSSWILGGAIVAGLALRLWGIDFGLIADSSTAAAEPPMGHSGGPHGRPN